MKFSIRELFLVTVIVSLAVGWWVERKQLWREVEDLSQKLTERNAELDLLKLERLRWPRTGVVLVPLPNSSAPTPNPPKN
jgi:hypothetical protein